MFSSLKALFGAVLTLFSGFGLAVSLVQPGYAAAQVETEVRSGALGELDLWGVGFLPASQTALPEKSWAASDAKDLLALTKNARVSGLSPVEQVLMRALVLSPADMPDAALADDLLAERARLMFRIGEAAAAARLMPSLKKAPSGLSPDALAIDLQLATGQAEAACLGEEAKAGTQSGFHARLRAVCSALFDRPEDAELALELSQNLSETGGASADERWFASAIYAATGALPDKPEARFDSGLSLALSAKAGLEPSVQSMARSRKDLAAAIARQDSFAPVMRVQAAGVAAEAGLLDAKTHREIYKGLIETEGFRARTPLEVALQTSMSAGNDTGAKARTLRAALRTARGNAARFSAVSRLLLPDLQALTQGKETERMALDFAYASLAAGAPDEAMRWIEGLPGADGETFEQVWMSGIMVLAGANLPDGTTGKVTTRLLKVAKTRQQKQATARLFTLWNALEIGLPPDARAMLATYQAPSGAPAVSPFLLGSLEAAAREGAGAELVLRLLGLTKGDAYRLAPQDVGALVSALKTLGQGDAARLLALEATGYWRASL